MTASNRALLTTRSPDFASRRTTFIEPTPMTGRPTAGLPPRAAGLLADIFAMAIVLCSTNFYFVEHTAPPS